jgi:prepilin-type N-terminal cleavage/methylation domain-containing protein
MTTSMIGPHIKSKALRGFTLTEVAIVMGVIGIILAGLWAVISSGWETTHRQQASDEITIVTGNVRNYYSGQIGMPNAGYDSISSNLLSVGTIPGYMQRASTSGCTNPNNLCADNPWGSNSGSPLTLDAIGTFRVCNWNTAVSPAVCASSAPGATSQFFGIMLTGLSQSSCIGLISRVTMPSGPLGLIDVSINGTNIFGTLTHAIQPVAVSDANQYCPPGVAGTATVVFAYKLAPS